MRAPRSTGRRLYIPARDARHRLAVCGLYRALLRAADQVSLPPERFSIGIHRQIRYQIRQNAHETSGRLVFAAMTAGYKFLSLLQLARNPQSVEYSEIISILSKRDASIAARARRAAKKAAKLPPRHPKVLTKEPMILRVSDPGEHPRYAASRPPAPIEDLKSERRVPMVAATADGVPFLRRPKRRQPPGMSRMIGSKVKWYVKSMGKMLEVDEESGPDAFHEDRWERLIRYQMLEEGIDTSEFSPDLKETHVWSLQLNRLWWEWKVDNIWQDWLARGEALQRIVDDEQELADKEQGKKRTIPEPSRTEANVVARSMKAMPPSITDGQNWPLRKPGLPMPDPFMSEEWKGVIDTHIGRLVKLTKAVRSEASAGSG